MCHSLETIIPTTRFRGTRYDRLSSYNRLLSDGQKERERKRERDREKGKNQKQVKKKEKNATYVRLYVLYNINAHHSRLCTWSPWEILLNDVHTLFCFTIPLDPHTKY